MKYRSARSYQLEAMFDLTRAASVGGSVDFLGLGEYLSEGYRIHSSTQTLSAAFSSVSGKRYSSGRCGTSKKGWSSKNETARAPRPRRMGCNSSLGFMEHSRTGVLVDRESTITAFRSVVSNRSRLPPTPIVGSIRARMEFMSFGRL